MNKQEFQSGAMFCINNVPGFDFCYSESMFGGEVIISGTNGKQRIEVEEITTEYFVIDCWITRGTNGRIYFKNCELK